MNKNQYTLSIYRTAALTAWKNTSSSRFDKDAELELNTLREMQESFEKKNEKQANGVLSKLKK